MNQKIRPGGKVEIGGLVDGKQTAGESKLLSQEQLEAGAAAAADALNRQKIPREYMKHYKEYIEQFRGEKSGSGKSSAPNADGEKSGK